uniref:Solute-binding protein family 3/N-terminal domain-containing protein n=1 Tax=Magnetococcus massalia (strain MO-1) TaxID=451514 RepID=A0A1S7LDX0_MAGMO|nr:Exported protein of unknown function [Candidatus Magnetococcus massalia]
MSRLISLFFTLTLALSISLATVSESFAQDDEDNIITVAVPNSIFASLRDGHPAGIIVEGTVAVLAEMGYTMRFLSMSSKDQKRAVYSGDIDVATSMLVSFQDKPKRSKKALFTDAVINEYNVIVVRRGEGFKLNKVEDLYGKKIGARIGFTYPSIQGDDQVQLERNRKDGENIRKLMLKELDAAIVGGVSDLFDFGAEGIMGQIESLNKAVGYVGLGAALSNLRFSPEDLAKFNQTLASFKMREEWNVILERNGMRTLVFEWPLIAPKK